MPNQTTLPPTTLVQYRCEKCNKPITEARPGWIEAFDELKGKRVYPLTDFPKVSVHHQRCRKVSSSTSTVELPEEASTLGDSDRPFASYDTVAHQQALYRKKTWGWPMVNALDAWEPLET